MKLLSNIKPGQVLFLDIETVPVARSYEELPVELKDFWDKKASQITKDDTPPEEVYERAGIYSEFGKIISISVGVITGEKPGRGLRLKSFFGHDEKKLLEEFSLMLSSFCSGKEAQLCAHNGKEFDFPYIARRMMINGLKVPGILDNAGKKPWEVNLLDTMELWKLGDYKHYTSLALLTTIFGIPSPKDDIDGSMVADIYYVENDLNRIVKYCEKDVIALVQIYLRFMNEPVIEDSLVESVTKFD